MLNETREADSAYRTDIDEAYQRGYAQGKADAEPHWIPCKDHLPKKSGRYFAWAVISCVPDHVDDPGTFEGMEIAYYGIEGNGGVWFGNHIEKVIAWMPLPEPYKGVTE